MSRIFVIGASGKTGRHLVDVLAEQGVSVRAASRCPEQLASAIVDRARFDWNDESTWLPALESVDAVYLVKPEATDVVERVRRFLDAMKSAGVGRLVLLSECAAETRPDSVAERQVEKVVEISDCEWTILRPSWFMDDVVDANFFGPMVRGSRTIAMTTGGSAIAWIDARDVAAVAAELLRGGGYVREAVDISGPEALTLDQLSARITAVAGVTITAIEESVLEAETRMRAEGLDDGFIAYMTRIAESIVAGDTAAVSDQVERITGRPPRSLSAFLVENVARLHPPSTSIGVVDAEQELRCARANEALFRRMIAAWARSDFDDLIDCFADDVVYIDMPFPDEPVRGKASFRKHVERYNALFADGHVDVEFLTLVGNSTTVVGELLCRARYLGAGAAPGGVEVTWHATLVDTIANGQVVTEHVYFDPTAFDRAVHLPATV